LVFTVVYLLIKQITNGLMWPINTECKVDKKLLVFDWEISRKPKYILEIDSKKKKIQLKNDTAYLEIISNYSVVWLKLYTIVENKMVSIRVYFPIQKSWSKNKRKKKLNILL
jgi:hypothetical protein